MPSLTFVTWRHAAADLDLSRITDLAIIGSGSGAVLYATTRFDGAISAWGIDGTGITAIDSAAYQRVDSAGTVASLGFVQTDAGLAVLTGGGSGGPLTLHATVADGSFGAATSLGTMAAFGGDLIQTVTVDLEAGGQAVYGGIAGQSGIGRLLLDGTGALISSSTTADTTASHADRVSALAQAHVGGTDYVFSASTIDPGITAWAVDSSGTLTASAHLGTAQDLWVAAPTALEVVQVAGQSYLILAAAGSGTLSVIGVAPDGGLQITDHVLDDLDSRFAGVTALATVNLGGQSFVIAGGADDGISVYQLLPGGRLLARAHLADGTAMGLENISAIAAHVSGGVIDIFVASGTEAGLTRACFDPGPIGQTLLAGAAGGTLTGTAINDVLLGGAGVDRITAAAGDDILIDGAGSDTMTGGSGADTFVLSLDGVTDTIADFTPGQDRIDLSGWGLLRNTGQLQMTSTATGLRIAFGNEVLLITSASGTPIDPASLTGADLINLTRVWANPGTVPGPGEPAPNPTPAPLPGDMIGCDQSDMMTGTAAANRLFALDGDDTLYGAAGNDTLYGGNGNDRLDGGDGTDRMCGEAGDDLYVVGQAGDLIDEGTGQGSADRVAASISFALAADDQIEVMTTLSSTGTSAINLTGNALVQSITGNAGANVLSSGGGAADRMIGLGGNDSYRVYNSADRVYETAGQGSDRVMAAVSYVLASGVSVEFLTTNGSTGTSAINLTGNALAQSITGNAGANVLSDGGGAADTLTGLGGNDTYIIRSSASRIVEATGGGTDRVSVAISYTLAADSDIEVLTTTSSNGTAALNLTGNALAQTITGNAGINMLDGGIGAADQLYGLGGSDIYRVHQAADRVYEGTGQGTADRVAAGISYVLGAGQAVELLTTLSSTGTSAINLTGNALVQSITGNAGANVLSSGGGAADRMIGLGGNDSYRVYNSADRVYETAGQGSDRVMAAVSYVLASGVSVEFLTTNGSTGTSAINLTGNALAQSIFGNAGANVLSDGGGAADTLTGLGGNDTYILHTASTGLIEGAGQGTDRVAVAMSYTLADADADIEVLTTTAFAGTAAINLTGNSLAQSITGNAGANRIDGRGGSDTLTGGGGADRFVFSTPRGMGNIDSITDFNTTQDLILLDHAIFQTLYAGHLLAGSFRANLTGQAGDASDRVIYNSANGYLYFDADGTGAGGRVHFATLDAHLALTYTDIVVI